MNISNSNDPFYRYKRPKFEIQVFNKKIWILNINQIAKALNRDSTMIAKFLGKCCSTSAKINNKQNYLEINAVYTLDQLDVFLQKFIDKYVLCPACEIPETSLNKKSNRLVFNCKACGNMSKLDVKDKYDTLIFNTST